MFSNHTSSTLLSIFFFMLAIHIAAAHSPVCEFQQGLTLEEVEIGNLLTWSTATAAPSMQFIIQRSSDGQHFATIGQVDGNEEGTNQQSYQFLDLEIGQPSSYYRLLCMHEGQQTLITPSVFCHRRTQNNWKISRMTNTVTTAPFSFTMECIQGTTLQVTLSDTQGQTLQTYPVKLRAGQNELVLDMAQCPTGTYRMNLDSAGEHEQLILQKIAPDRIGSDGYAIRE